MSLLTKMRDFIRVPFVWLGRGLVASRGKWTLPGDEPGSAGVLAPLKPKPPVLVGANARAFPPKDE